MKRYTQAERRAARESLGKPCKACGEMFYPKPGMAKMFDAKVYCSWKCRYKAAAQKPKDDWLTTYRKSVQWSPPKMDKPYFEGELITDCIAVKLTRR